MGRKSLFSQSSIATTRALVMTPRTRVGIVGWLLVFVVVSKAQGGTPVMTKKHSDTPPPSSVNSAAAASVNRHVLLQIHATVTSSSASCNSNNKPPPSSSSSSWILTIDELEDQQPQAQDRHNHLMTTTTTATTRSISSLFPLDKELFLIWQTSSSSFGNQDSNNICWQGTAGTSLALPLQQDGRDATTRTLILALWHTTNNKRQRTLLARNVTQVPRTIHDATIISSLSRMVHLQGQAPPIAASQTGGSLVSITSAVLLLLFAAAVSFSSRDKRRAYEDEQQAEEEQDYHHHDDPNAELDNENEENDASEQHNPQEWMLENLPPVRRNGRHDDDGAASDDSSSMGPAMPPVMERYVVRPKPAHGITFETEMEHFKQLQLGSPQHSRTSRGARNSSPGVTHFLSQPTLDRPSFMSPQQSSFASLSQQQPWTSPLPWQASVMDSAGKALQKSAFPPGGSEQQETKQPNDDAGGGGDSARQNTLDSFDEKQLAALMIVSKATIPENNLPAKPVEVPASMVEAMADDKPVQEDPNKEFVNLETGADIMGNVEHMEEGSASEADFIQGTGCQAGAAEPKKELQQTDDKDRSHKLETGLSVHETPEKRINASVGEQASLQSGGDRATTTSCHGSVPAATMTGVFKESPRKESSTEKEQQQSSPTNKSTPDTTQTQPQNAVALLDTESRPVLGGQANLSQSQGTFLLSQQEGASLNHVAILSQPSELFPLSEMEDQSISRVANLSQHSDSSAVVLGLDAEKQLDCRKPNDTSMRDRDGSCRENEEFASTPSDSTQLQSKPNESSEKAETMETNAQTPPIMKRAPINLAGSSQSTRLDVKVDPVPQQRSNWRPESTETTDPPNIPRVTPLYEKPVSDVARNCESFSDIQAPIRESIISEDKSSTEVSPVVEKSPHPRSTESAKSTEHSAPLTEPQALKKSSLVAFVQAAQYSSPASQKGTNGSSPFTYVSTLSPDSRASSVNWTETRNFAKNLTHCCEGSAEPKASAGRGSQVSGQKRRSAAKEKHPISYQQQKTVDPCGGTSHNSKSSHVGSDDGEIEVVAVRRPDPAAFLPEVVLSDSLRNAKQDFEARPVWQFSNEEAVKPVDKTRRRRPNRKPARERAPFMSPASNTRSASRPEAKRKFIDITDFKTPPLHEPGGQSKRRGSSSKTPPRKPEKDAAKCQEFTESNDPIVNWSESKSVARCSTFPRKKRSSETQSSVSTPP
eukprot:scaffold3341_cov171-Amphora_coffeaeformis.AAC.3